MDQLKGLPRDELACLSAEYDESFLVAMQECGYDRSRIITFITELRSKIHSGALDCQGVKRELKKHCKKPRAQKTVMQYRRKLAEWVNCLSDYPTPPQLDLQQLPLLTKETLDQYLDILERKTNDFIEVKRPIIEGDETWNQKKWETLPLEDLFKVFARQNCMHLIEEFVEESEENALKVLIHIFDISNDLLVLHNEELLRCCIRRLSHNVHFVRSLFNLIDEHFKDGPSLKRIHPLTIETILGELGNIGVCQTCDAPQESIDNSVPRSRVQHKFNFRYRWPDGHEERTVELLIPAQFIPAHWNGHRLVNPARNRSFAELAARLDAIEMTNEMNAECSRHLDGIINRRRYISDFTRIRVDDIPNTEPLDIWFHYFHHAAMLPHIIGVELVVNGAGTVFFLDDEGVLLISPRGNLNPPIDIDLEHALISSHPIDRLAVNPLDWLTEKGVRNLRFYILKYAYHLLVEPRTVAESNSADRGGGGGNRFNIRLTEYSTEITIPSTSQGNRGGEEPTRRITVYHGVTGHVRRLPEGWQPSQEAIEAAHRRQIFLLPGQTFVKPHHRGSELAEQTEPPKRVRS